MIAHFKRLISNNTTLFAIILLSLIVNLWHIGFGAVQSIYPDETFFDLYAFKIINYAMGNGIDYSLDPPVYSFCLALAYCAYFGYGFLIGQFHSMLDFSVHFATHREDFIILARIVSALFATATLPFTYKIAEHLFNKKAATIATLGLTLSYPIVWFAHTVHHTTISAFITVVILYTAIKAGKSGSWKDYILCGISLGIGIGVKLYPAMFALSLVVIHFQRNPPRIFSGFQLHDFKKLFTAGLLSLLVMMIVYPWPFIEHVTWQESIKYSNVFFTGGDPWTNLYYVVWGKSVYYEATSAEPFSFWSNSLRIVSETTLLLMIVSIGYILFRYPSKWLILFPVLIIFTVHHMLRGGLAMGVRQFYFLLPTLYIAVGAMLTDVSERVIPETKKLYRVLFLSLFFIQPVFWLSQYLMLLTHPTTQELGRKWLSEHAGSGDLVLVNYAAPFSNIANWYTMAGSDNDPINTERKKLLPAFTVQQLKESDYKTEVLLPASQYKHVYIVLTDYNSTVYYKYDNCKLWGEHKYHKFIEKTAFFNQVYRHGKPVQQISPVETKSLGPTVTIYELIR
jgi:4-amino-4-deoxy-L-arabinose transferase-like glycosyltransferase